MREDNRFDQYLSARAISIELPPATERYGGFLASADVDWADEQSVVDYLVGYARMLAGR